LLGLVLAEGFAQIIGTEVVVLAIAAGAGIKNARLGHVDPHVSAGRASSANEKPRSPMTRVGLIAFAMSVIAFAKGESRGGLELVALGVAILLFYEWLRWRNT
jgi:hypothetical protein